MDVLKPISIDAVTISDAWFQAVYAAVTEGRTFNIDKGSFALSKRLELDFVTIHIRRPWDNPMLPQLNPVLGLPDPVQEGYVEGYSQYLLTPDIDDNEAYTYGNRLYAQDITTEVRETNIDLLRGIFTSLRSNPCVLLNQVDYMIRTYKAFGPRNNQMVLQIAKPSDMSLVDPPCLRHIDTRIQDGALHFFPYFRSWDLWSGFPANLAIIEMLKQICASEIGVDNGQIIATSKGLHLYDYTFELSEAVTNNEIAVRK